MINMNLKKISNLETANTQLEIISLPHATKFPDGAYAHVITQLDLNGMAWTWNHNSND